MLAFVGFASEAAVTGRGPIEALQYHLEDPKTHNIYTSPVSNEFTAAVCALAVLPTLIEARLALTPGAKDDEEFRPIPFV